MLIPLLSHSETKFILGPREVGFTRRAELSLLVIIKEIRYKAAREALPTTKLEARAYSLGFTQYYDFQAQPVVRKLNLQHVPHHSQQ